MKHPSFLVLASVASGIVAAFLAAPLFHTHEDARSHVHAMWAHPYATLEQMRDDADAVVVGTVVQTIPGRIEFTSGGENVLPFPWVDVAVDELVLGQAPRVVTVEQTGGSMGDTSVYIEDDGGPYRVGEQVLLFLKEQPDTGLHYVSHPKGRFHVRGGVVEAVLHGDPVADGLNERSLRDAVALIRR